MVKKTAEQYQNLLNELEKYLTTIAKLTPRNIPDSKKEVLMPIVKELQLIINNFIKFDLTNARKLPIITNEHNMRRLDEKIKQLRGVELTKEMRRAIVRISK